MESSRSAEWGMYFIFSCTHEANLTLGHFCVKILNMGYVELGVFFINIHADMLQ